MLVKSACFVCRHKSLYFLSPNNKAQVFLKAFSTFTENNISSNYYNSYQGGKTHPLQFPQMCPSVHTLISVLVQEGE